MYLTYVVIIGAHRQGQDMTTVANRCHHGGGCDVKTLTSEVYFAFCTDLCSVNKQRADNSLSTHPLQTHTHPVTSEISQHPRHKDAGATYRQTSHQPLFELQLKSPGVRAPLQQFPSRVLEPGWILQVLHTVRLWSVMLHAGAR